MGISERMSRIPTGLQPERIMEDSDKPDAIVTTASTVRIVPLTAELACKEGNVFEDWPCKNAPFGERTEERPEDRAEETRESGGECGRDERESGGEHGKDECVRRGVWRR